MSIEYSEMNREVVSERFSPEDAFEAGLRPKTLEEYIGQEKVKANLSVFIQGARQRMTLSFLLSR